MRHPHDHYPTPKWVVEAVVPHLPNSCIWHEPACGPGRNIVRVLNRCGIETTEADIQGTPSVDFLRDFTPRQAIITNPPYSLAFEFVKHACNHAHSVVMLLRLNFLASQQRGEWFRRCEPRKLLVLSRRPSFTADGKTDNSDYAWFFWGEEFQREIVHHL